MVVKLEEGARTTKPAQAKANAQAKSNLTAQKAHVYVPSPRNDYRAVQTANPGMSWDVARRIVDSGQHQPMAVQQQPARKVTTGGSGGGGRGYGGGGGGGGGGAAAAAQNQINAMAKLLQSGQYTANPAAYDAQRTSLANATAQDQAAATGAYNNLDTWLTANQTNPYANVKIQRAAASPSYNPYLESQGLEGSAPMASNPSDGGYEAFQNVLSLLGANQLANNASGLRQSQEARTFSGQQIGAMDNGYQAQIAAQQAQAQQALDAERRAALLQLTTLLGTPGTTAPDLSALGITL